MSQGNGDAAEKRNEPPPSKIEALDGSNYEEWSGRMRSAFKRYKWLKLAMGEEKMPEEGDAHNRWIEKSAVLYDLILQLVNNDMFQHIKDLVELDDSGPKAWKLLRDVIQPNTLPMVIVLEKELAALSMRPGNDVKSVLDKIKDTYARMVVAGSNVSQMQQCTKIISVLDNSWDNLIPTLNTQQDQWTPEWLRQQILQEDFRMRHTSGGAANKTAEGLVANILSVRRLKKSKAQPTFGPTSCRAKLGKLLLWDLEEKSSCIKDLWQLPIIPWNGKLLATAAAAATAKATAGGEETAPSDGALDAVKKVQQPQQQHGEVLAGVDATAAWAKASSGSGEANWETWHERLCHVNFPMLQKLVKDGSLKRLEVKGAVKEIGSCPTFLETKFTKFPFSSGTGPAKAPLALVHMDVVGPTRAPSLSGSHYFLTIVDDHTRAVWVYPLKTKGEVAAAVLKEWMPRAQRESGHKVKVIRTNNGGEFIGADFEAVLKKKGIQHQLTVPHNPQQNGVAERFNRTLQEGARTLLGRAGLPDPFWVTALRQVALVKNRVLATVGDKQWVPYTKWYGTGSSRMVPQAGGDTAGWGFKKSECDHSLFLLQEKEQFLMLLVYVDDFLLFSESSAMIERVEEMLEMQFKCSKMGDVKYYLGMHVERDLDKGVLRLHRKKYCEGLAEKYGLQDGGKPAIPLPSGFTVEPCADEEVVGESDRKLFHSMVGALNYPANHTRPDIAFATSRLASVVSRPNHEQLEAAKRLVRYVSAITYVGLEYSAVRQRQQRGAADSGKGEMLLTSYTDTSFNSVKADGTSIGGCVCLFGGGVVSWRRKKQNEVGLSSCKTEYMALHHGVKIGG
ncbi:unnamed protein product [Closterium sp. NIES-54]